MTASNGGTTPAEVWGSTWIPGPSPVDGFGDATGYSIAWVRASDGRMLQVLVDGTAAPEPGAPGAVRSVAAGDDSLDVFAPSTGADR